MVDSTVKVFLSYSHEDEALRSQLAQHLKPLERQGKILLWCDREIAPGSDWRQTLDTQLNAADLILLLVSPSFISSDFCYCTELVRAKERHNAGTARLLPIFLRPIDLDTLEGTPLQTLQGLPAPDQPITTWQNRDAAFAQVASGIRTVVMELQSTTKPASTFTPNPSKQTSPSAPTKSTLTHSTPPAEQSSAIADSQLVTSVLAMAKRSLAILEEQAAGFGKLHIPAHLQLELEAKRQQVAELEARSQQQKKRL